MRSSIRRWLHGGKRRHMCNIKLLPCYIILAADLRTGGSRIADLELSSSYLHFILFILQTYVCYGWFNWSVRQSASQSVRSRYHHIFCSCSGRRTSHLVAASCWCWLMVGWSLYLHSTGKFPLWKKKSELILSRLAVLRWWLIFVGVSLSSLHSFTPITVTHSILGIPNGFGKHMAAFGPRAEYNFFLGFFMAEVIYTVIIVFVKYSILALYWRVFRSTSIKWPVAILAAIVTSWGIAVVSFFFYR